MADLHLVTTTDTELERLVDDFLASARARGLAPSTVDRGYSVGLRKVFLPWCAANGITRLDELDQRTLDRFTSALLSDGTAFKRDLSKVTVHTYAEHVRRLLNWCQRQGEVVKAKPQLPRLARRVVDVLSRKEIDAMEIATPTERDKLIIRLFADTGIRSGELRVLTTADVVHADRRNFIKVHGKGGHERLVPLTPALARRIERHVQGRSVDATSSLLFLAHRRNRIGLYEPLGRSAIGRIVNDAASRAGIRKRVHPHLFRHSFATEALRRGMNPLQLAQVLGHTSLRMIERTYSHLNASDAYDAVLRMLASN